MATIRPRRAPPPFRRVEVVEVASRTPHLVRVTLGGPELAGLDPGLPAASVRLLLPHHGDLVLPRWDGNEFRHEDGTRPHLRTLTPRRLDPERHHLDVEIVVHGDGPLSVWATRAVPGQRVALSGTGRGYTIDPVDRIYVLAGDESALPAIGQLLEALPVDASVLVLGEIAEADARLDLPDRPGAIVSWHERSSGSRPGDALVAAVQAAAIDPSAKVWVAGEAAAVQRIRRHLFEERGLDRSRCTVRGYWKHGRASDAD